MPWGVMLLALAVAAYTFSPIDLIPDFIPVLGLLDDVVLVPLGIALVIRLAPQPVIESDRQKAERAVDKPVSRAGAVVVMVVWGVALVWLGVWARSWVGLR